MDLRLRENISIFLQPLWAAIRGSCVYAKRLEICNPVYFMDGNNRGQLDNGFSTRKMYQRTLREDNHRMGELDQLFLTDLQLLKCMFIIRITPGLAAS